MLKCNNNNNNEKLYESGLCVLGEKIRFNSQQQQQQHKQQVHYNKSQITRPVIVKQSYHPARRTERKTLHLNIVDNFHGDDVCGELLKTIRKSGEVEDFKRFLQTEAQVKKNDDLRRKYTNVYYDFFGVHYELLKSRIRIE